MVAGGSSLVYFHAVAPAPPRITRPRMPLDAPPRLRLCGTGVHGRPRAEAFTLDAWSLHLYGYEAALTLPGEALTLRPGLLTVVPPGVPMGYRFAGRSEHLFAHFELEGSAGAGAAGLAAVVREPDAGVAGLRARLASALGFAAAAPRRAEAQLWALLFELDARPAGGEAGAAAAPPEVVATLAAIETGLHRPLRVAELARAAGVPHNRLTRGFRAHTGRTVAGHLRHRRVERAVTLLTTTDRPVSSIACEVGVPDLQAFNKLVRAAEGVSPRAVRERAGAAGGSNEGSAGLEQPG